MSIRKKEIINVFMNRDSLSLTKAEEKYKELKAELVEALYDGIEAVEEVLYGYGLELDYVC